MIWRMIELKSCLLNKDYKRDYFRNKTKYYFRLRLLWIPMLECKGAPWRQLEDPRDEDCELQTSLNRTNGRTNEQRLTFLELSSEPKIMKEKRKVSRTAWQPIILILRSRQKYQKVIEIRHNLFILVYSHVPAPL